ncbi:uncharacterized protein LOC125664557 [Ostrea edulis]|nr:uncharacterized protein LOC125664557 [Ostrea edulis]
MGYTPKRKLLKEDALPTIFDDSKPKKIRESSSKRYEKKEKQELINRLLENTCTEPCDQPGPSTSKETDVPINQRKRKLPGKIKSSKK